LAPRDGGTSFSGKSCGDAGPLRQGALPGRSTVPILRHLDASEPRVGSPDDLNLFLEGGGGQLENAPRSA